MDQMNKRKLQVGSAADSSSSSSSFTLELFGPKDVSSSSSFPGLFGSVLGPRHGIGHVHHNNNTSSSRNQGLCFLPSSTTSTTTTTTTTSTSNHYSSPHQNMINNNINNLKRNDIGGDNHEDPNVAGGVSRGNWWQGSLYY